MIIQLNKADMIAIGAELDSKLQLSGSLAEEARRDAIDEKQRVEQKSINDLISILHGMIDASAVYVAIRDIFRRINELLREMDFTNKNTDEKIKEIGRAVEKQYVDPAKENLEKVQIAISTIIAFVRNKIGKE